jgi:hypothetical protein
MVYELLPIKTTFHVFHHDDSLVGATLQLVWKTLSGINVLATCHEINFEAKAILGPVLDQLKQERIRLVASAEKSLHHYGPRAFHKLRLPLRNQLQVQPRPAQSHLAGDLL